MFGIRKFILQEDPIPGHFNSKDYMIDKRESLFTDLQWAKNHGIKGDYLTPKQMIKYLTNHEEVNKEIDIEAGINENDPDQVKA